MDENLRGPIIILLFGVDQNKGGHFLENPYEKYSSQKHNMKKQFWGGCTKNKGIIKLIILPIKCGILPQFFSH